MFSTFQKIAIGAPLVVSGYFVPILFGGITGLIICLWNAKLRESRNELLKFHEKLETRVNERTNELKNALFALENTQKSLRESEEQFRLIFYHSPIAKEHYDEKGALIDVNEACLNLFGIKSRQEIQGFNLFDDPNLPDEQKQSLQAGNTIHYQTDFDFEKVKAFKLYSTSRNGIIWIDVLITPMGNTLRGYLVQIQDITKSKLMEAELQESEARWRFALEGSGNGVWDWNTVTNRVFFSEQWKAMLGYDEKEIDDTLNEWDSRVHPDDKDAVHADIEAHLSGQTAFYQNEHRVLCKDGSYKWILDRGKVIEWTNDGKPLRVIGTHSDISDRKRVEIERERLIAELKAASAEIKSFSGLLPICSVCKKIRDDKGYWRQIEAYIEEHSEVDFSHSICPECIKKHYSEYDIFVEK